MIKNAIANKSHLKEILARNPELLEKGLKLVDTDIEIFAGDQADMLALDKEKRLVVLAFSAEPQSLRTNKGIHLLKEAFHSWNWFTGFKEGLLEETEKKIGARPVQIPPRLAVIAPAFTGGLISLAKKAAKSLIDLELYTYDKNNFRADRKPFRPISLKSDLEPAVLPDSIAFYHAEKLDDYWTQHGTFYVEARQGKGYHASSLSDLLGAVGLDFQEVFQKFNEDILTLECDLRPAYRGDTIIYRDAYGNEVCSVSLHDLYGFSLLVGGKLFYWGEKPDKKQEQTEKIALNEIESYAATLRKKIEKTG